MQPDAALEASPRRGFRVDVGRLVFALALAVLLYVFAVNETNPETTRRPTFSVPVEVVNAPPRLVVTGPVPSVELRVRAPQDVFNGLRPNDFVAQADASGAREGDVELPVTVRSEQGEVRDVSAAPARITVRFEPVQERTLPVRVNSTGQVPAGYRVGDARTDPARVVASGPRSVAQRAVEAVVDVSLDRATVTVNGAFTPRVVDDRGTEIKGLALRTTSVNVEVPIVQQAQFKEVGVRPLIIGQPAAGYFVEPVTMDPPTVTLVGDPSVLQEVSFVDTAPVDVSGLSTSAVRRVGLAPSRNTILLRPDQTVDVTIRVSPLIITQVLRVMPAVSNLPSNLLVDDRIDMVEVTLSGPAPTLSNLTARDLRVVLNVSGAKTGTNDVEVQVQNVPQGMTLDGVKPSRVTLRLRDAPPTPAPITPTPAATATTTPG